MDLVYNILMARNDLLNEKYYLIWTDETTYYENKPVIL